MVKRCNEITGENFPFVYSGNYDRPSTWLSANLARNITLMRGHVKKGLSSLRNKLTEYVKNMHTSNREPMIMNMTIWLQENASLFLDKPELDKTLNCGSSDDSILLLKLDHMRNKTRYIKTITRWIDELNLNGRLFFANHLILILLTGETSNVREYLRRHKTCNVDVDSCGKPCKEKMINVLVQEQAPSDLR